MNIFSLDTKVIRELNLYHKYLKDFRQAAEESVKYAEWSAYWIKKKNCQVQLPDGGYCSGSGSCKAVINPLVSSNECKFSLDAQSLGSCTSLQCYLRDRGGSSWTNAWCPFDRPSRSLNRRKYMSRNRHFPAKPWFADHKEAVEKCTKKISEMNWENVSA